MPGVHTVSVSADYSEFAEDLSRGGMSCNNEACSVRETVKRKRLLMGLAKRLTNIRNVHDIELYMDKVALMSFGSKPCIAGI